MSLSLQTVVAVLVVAAGVIGCSTSHSTDEDDAGILGPDGMVADARVEPACGDSRLDPMERCDDGNTLSGDGCDSMCRREAYCGDGALDPGEACDDGDNRSGDGCRSDCGSDETCGNGVRDATVGELCDDGNVRDGDGCSADCRLLEDCGDGMLDEESGETCDDGNREPFDGCGADCRIEVAVVIDNLAVGAEGQGCDYSGDGVPDNAFAEALGPLSAILPANLAESVTILISFMGLDDPAGVDDSSVTAAWIPGEATARPDEYVAASGAFDEDGNPSVSFESSIDSRFLSGGPEDVEIPLPGPLPLPLELRQGRIQAMTAATSGVLDRLRDGMLCGAVPVATFSLIPVPPMLPVVGDLTPCDELATPLGLEDLLIGGIAFFGQRGTPPDVDLDGDGLETYEVIRRGPSGCQPVIGACIDGDGTRVEGRGCARDPRFEDGWSAGLPFSAVAATLVAE